MGNNGTPVVCEGGEWTTVWQGPSLGYTYLTSEEPVVVQWRRRAISLPWYWEGTANVYGRIMIFHGLPAFYLVLEVNPEFTTALMATT